MVAPELSRRIIALGVVALAAVLQSVAVQDVTADGDQSQGELAHERLHPAWDPLALPSAPGGGDRAKSYGVRLLGSELVVPVPTSNHRPSHLQPTAAEPSSFVADFFDAASEPPAGDVRSERQRSRFDVAVSELEERDVRERWPENRDPVGAPIEITEEYAAPFVRFVF